MFIEKKEKKKSWGIDIHNVETIRTPNRYSIFFPKRFERKINFLRTIPNKFISMRINTIRILCVSNFGCQWRFSHSIVENVFVSCAYQIRRGRRHSAKIFNSFPS